ncbi:hypothetical protein MF672_024410 [Actinomadura sp. ATCC 31491]|uniref:Transmembrane protein n=1 Tax=Actinomadura luzonensis TaxID=2805427 RepID=A0ABT0FX44_9ACTN|nr:hypothetical protein [Actinomadura luzonensis]MCK2216911.1 hypothetical protein [Actinomadura luzonensis]
MRTALDSLMMLVRRYRLDGNPLRRRSDRQESALVAGAVLLVLLSVWPAVLAGLATYEAGMAETRVGPGGRQQVTAVLLEDAPAARASFSEAAAQPPQARARWTTPEGVARTGDVVAPGLAASGTQVRIWIDGQGRPATPPKKPLEIRFRGAGMTVFVLLTAAMLAAMGLMTGQWLLDRRRYRHWDTAWAVADKRWHGRQRG